jgi:hypothetical protein
MRITPLVFGSMMFVTVVAGSTVSAQEAHIVSSDSITRVVIEQVDAQRADRLAVHAALARPEVRRIASQMGLDLGHFDAAVETMNGADLAQAATAARRVNDSLVGGASTVVISTTAIIIALLIVLIIVIAV